MCTQAGLRSSNLHPLSVQHHNQCLNHLQEEKQCLKTQSKNIGAENLFQCELYCLISSSFQISGYFLASQSRLPRRWHPLKYRTLLFVYSKKIKGAQKNFSIEYLEVLSRLNWGSVVNIPRGCTDSLCQEIKLLVWSTTCSVSGA